MNKPIKIVIFDFDGVIVRRSEFFKQESWPLVFATYGERGVTAFREAEQIYGGGRGGDRFDILRRAFETLGEKGEDIPKLVEEGARTFDTQVQQKILAAGVTDADREVLERLAKRVPLYLNSATPQGALEQAVRNLGLASIIKKALGRPNTKVRNFEFACAKEHIAPDEMLFVGDADTDYAAAREFGCAFVGFGNEWNEWKEGDKPFPVIRDLAQVDTFSIAL